MVASNEAQNNSQSSLHAPGPGDSLAASKTSFKLYRVNLFSRFDNNTRPRKNRTRSRSLHVIFLKVNPSQILYMR